MVSGPSSSLSYPVFLNRLLKGLNGFLCLTSKLFGSVGFLYLGLFRYGRVYYQFEYFYLKSFTTVVTLFLL